MKQRLHEYLFVLDAMCVQHGKIRNSKGLNKDSMEQGAGVEDPLTHQSHLQLVRLLEEHER
eukprot:14919797-Ditylum_brightwellii.AAC.1